MGDTNYTCRIDRDAVAGGPAWDSSKPLPLSFAQAERIARAELAKLTTHEGTWQVTTFALMRANGTANWYYHVEMYPINAQWPDQRCFNIYMTAEGKPGIFYEER